MTFEKKIFVLLFFGFIAATTVGILSHEGGHYLMAKYYGFNEVRMRYNSTSLDAAKSSGKAASREQHLIMTAAGPVQTILTGTIGFICLLVFRKSYARKERLAAWQWVIIFLALFWLREISNLVREFYFVHFTAGHSFSGDEFLLSTDLGFSPWLLSVVLGGMAMAVLGVVTFKFVPLAQRFTFILSGFLGGIAGTILWLGIVGPRMMP